MLAVGQSLVFYIYAVGYFLGTHLIIEERTSYDRVFRSVHDNHDSFHYALISEIFFFI